VFRFRDVCCGVAFLRCPESASGPWCGMLSVVFVLRFHSCPPVQGLDVVTVSVMECLFGSAPAVSGAVQEVVWLSTEITATFRWAVW